MLTSSGRLVIEVPRLDSVTFRLFDNRWPGLQAPQHTVLFTKEMLLKCVRRAGLDVVGYLPYGAFPAYFLSVCWNGVQVTRWSWTQLVQSHLPLVLGQLALSPFLLFEKQLNLAMQTVICRKSS